MVRAFVEAGFSKIHLDASMRCADDRELSEATIAERGAALCAVAKSARAGRDLVYVIGTEVPSGGETEALNSLAVTKPEAAHRTFKFIAPRSPKQGIGDAIGRVIALVVQPGVDMGNTQVFGYDKAKAAALSAAVLDIPGVVFEAHSTDFQTEAAFTDLVAMHFPILKVGPSLTFAFREAVVAMAAIEERLYASGRSAALAVVEAGDGRQSDPLARLRRQGRKRAAHQAVRVERPRPLLLARPARRSRGQDTHAPYRRRVRAAGADVAVRRRHAARRNRGLCRNGSSERRSARSLRNIVAPPARSPTTGASRARLTGALRRPSRRRSIGSRPLRSQTEPPSSPNHARPAATPIACGSLQPTARCAWNEPL